jgi:hypothetical protein
MSIFTKVKTNRPPYNTFSLSHSKKLSFQIGSLIPVLCAEMIPGDQFDVRSSAMVRFMPMPAPVMGEFNVYMHSFFVPNRILWPKDGDNVGWEPFITGGEDGNDTTVRPYVELSTVTIGSVADYLGLPIYAGGTDTMDVSAFPSAAYSKIYSDYFRDENLQTSYDFAPLTDGLQSGTLLYNSVPRQRAWTKDYFTSALPWTQKGPEATIPLGTSANLNVTGSSGGLSYDQTQAIQVQRVDDSSFTGPDDITYRMHSSDNTRAFATLQGTDASLAFSGLEIDTSNVTVDLSTATAATINELRNAYRLQEYLERNARGGSRYIEVILSHFNVRSSDARLQRAEFIGGTKVPVQISEVLQTSESGGTPLGNMAGHGISVGGNKRMSYRAEEHGFFMVLLSVLPRAGYQQGIPKMFLREDRFDYYWPSFAHLGEQPIYNKELYWDGSDGEDDDVFGYTPRYAEYKYMPSTTAGQFRDTLDFWQSNRIFASRPALNAQFIECRSAELDRIFAVTTASDHKLWAQVYHDFKARRPMPYHGTPRT